MRTELMSAVLTLALTVAAVAVAPPAPVVAAGPSGVPAAADRLDGGGSGPSAAVLRLRAAGPEFTRGSRLRAAVAGPCAGLLEDPAATAAWVAAPAGGRGTAPCVAPPDAVDESAAAATVVTDTDDVIAPPVPCLTTGPYVKVFYVYRSGSSNRLAAWRSVIVRAVAAADLSFDRAAEAVGGATRHVRWAMDAACELAVTAVAVTGAHIDEVSPVPVRDDLVAKGLLGADDKALVFTDDGGTRCAGLAGIATATIDDSPGPTNQANRGRSIARVFGWCTADPELRSVSLGSIAAHEVMHTLGAVQPTAPHATPYGHCYDEADAMCYADGAGPMQDVCPAEKWVDAFDCNKDDYFNPAPPAGSWLATHWNSANSRYLATTHPVSTSPAWPTAAIASPAGATVVAGDVLVEVVASSGADAVARVDVYANGRLVGSATAAPFRVTLRTGQDADGWAAVPNGPLALDAVAWDAAGRWAIASTVTVEAGNPRVRLSSPAEGSLVTVPISWSAEPLVAAGRTVASVELLAGDEVVASDTAAPFGGSWTATSWSGRVPLQARVTDSAGQVATSPVVTVGLSAVHLQPRVPASAMVGRQTRLAVEVDPWPGTVEPGAIDVLVAEPGGPPVLVGTAAAPAFTIAWTPATTGTHEVTFRPALGAFPGSEVTDIVSVQPELAGHTVTITAPHDGAPLAASSTSLSATVAVPADRVVDAVSFFIDGPFVHLPAMHAGGGTWTRTWDNADTATGIHSLTAVATVRDPSTGETTTVAGPAVVVRRPGPTITISEPSDGTVVADRLTVAGRISPLAGDPISWIEICVTVAACQWLEPGGDVSATWLAEELPPDGSATAWIVAYTAHGVGASREVPVTIDAERFAMVSPIAGAAVGGRVRLGVDVSIGGTARVERVTFLVDGAPGGATEGGGWDSEFETEWNSGLASPGPHLLSARAQLSDGRTLDASPIAVTVVAPGRLVNPIARTGGLAAVGLGSTRAVRWSATPAGSPITGYDVRYRRARWNADFGEPVTWLTGTTATGATLAMPVGYTYCVSVRAHDARPSVSPWSSETCTTRPLDDRSLAKSRGWTSGTGTSFYLHTFRRTTARGAKLVRTGVSARSIALVATTCPRCGSVRVYLGSTLLRTIRLTSGTTRHRRLIPVASFCLPQTGTVTIKVISSGRRVTIDGLAIGG